MSGSRSKAQAHCILGNQLFAPELLPLSPKSNTWIFMREDHELCTHFRYHKHKIIFFLSAMRKYAQELRHAGFQVHYEKLGEHTGPFETRLITFLKDHHCTSVSFFEIEDKFFEKRIREAMLKGKFGLNTHPTPMFLTSREQFLPLVRNAKKPFMKVFYEAQRKRLGILLTPAGGPEGDQWSFDEDNREKLPRGHRCPPLPRFNPDEIDREIFALVDREFSDHPGSSAGFWLPTSRAGARQWARDFIEHRLDLFGPYEDAISKEEPFLYHSVLTPFLNTGLITPEDCVRGALKAYQQKKVRLNSCEGFIRQIIGWREFIRGIYQNFSELQESKNHFNHQRGLSDLWYSGKTGVEPLDDVLSKVEKFAYAHHIERLMVVGSLMVLLEIHPREAHRWFMEMFIDSSDWVMGPNVYGMALFSDGGLFATKPYICGSNYYRKMSGAKQGEWFDGVDGLYWTFIRKNRSTFAKNPRMSMMVRACEKIPSEKMKRLEAAAETLRGRLTKEL